MNVAEKRFFPSACLCSFFRKALSVAHKEGQPAMKKKSPQVIEAASDTGIYRDEPKVLFPLDTAKDWQAFEQRAALDRQLFDLTGLLSEAETFARDVRARYVVDGKTLSPSKANGIPDNVKRQVHYARFLRSQVALTRLFVERGDTQKAAAHAYWVGRYYEALRMTSIEHVAHTGRKVRRGGREGAARAHGLAAQKIARGSAYQKTIDDLHKKFSRWGYKKLCAEAGTLHRVSARTIERHTKKPTKIN